VLNFYLTIRFVHHDCCTSLGGASTYDARELVGTRSCSAIDQTRASNRPRHVIPAAAERAFGDPARSGGTKFSSDLIPAIASTIASRWGSAINNSDTISHYAPSHTTILSHPATCLSLIVSTTRR